MPITWTEAQLRKHQAKHGSQEGAEQTAPQPASRPKPQKARTAHSVAPEAAEWVWGTFGRRGHLWARNVKPDCSGWVSRCGAISSSKEPDGKHGQECAECARGVGE